MSARDDARNDARNNILGAAYDWARWPKLASIFAERPRINVYWLELADFIASMPQRCVEVATEEEPGIQHVDECACYRCTRALAAPPAGPEPTPTQVVGWLSAVGHQDLSKLPAGVGAGPGTRLICSRCERGDCPTPGQCPPCDGTDLTACGGCGRDCVVWWEDRPLYDNDPCAWIREPGMWVFDCKSSVPRDPAPESAPAGTGGRR